MPLPDELIGDISRNQVMGRKGLGGGFSQISQDVIGDVPSRGTAWRVTGDGMELSGLPEGAEFSVDGIVGLNGLIEDWSEMLVRRNAEDAERMVYVDSKNTTNKSGKNWSVFVEFGVGKTEGLESGVGFMGRAVKSAMSDKFEGLVDKTLGQGSRFDLDDMLSELAKATAARAKVNASEVSSRIAEAITVAKGNNNSLIANVAGESGSLGNIG